MRFNCWMQATSIDRDPHVLYELARAQEAAGQPQEARATYAEFEKLANEPGRATDESKTRPHFDVCRKPRHRAQRAEACAAGDCSAAGCVDAGCVRLGALCQRKFQDADAAVQKAIAVGIQSAQIFDHAGHIAQKLNRSADATKYFQLSIQSNPASEYAADALKSAVPRWQRMTASRELLRSHLQPALLQAAVRHAIR